MVGSFAAQVLNNGYSMLVFISFKLKLSIATISLKAKENLLLKRISYMALIQYSIIQCVRNYDMKSWGFFDNFVCVLLKIDLLVTKASKAEAYFSSFYMCHGKNVNIITIKKPLLHSTT